MEQKKLSELEPGNVNEGIYRITGFTKQAMANGSDMARFTLSDVSGQLGAVEFDVNSQNLVNEEKLQPAGFGQVRFVVDDHAKYGRQAKVSFIQGLNTSEVPNLEQLIPSIPNRQENFEELLQLAGGIENPGYRAVACYTLEKFGKKLVDLPAAKAMHHDRLGGWVFHTLRMARSGKALCPIYPELDESLLLCGIILHDLGKFAEFQTDQTGLVADYTLGGALLSHLILGPMMLQKIRDEMKHAQNEGEPAAQLTNNQYYALLHILESHHGRPEYGSPVGPMFMEAMVIHYLDQIDAKIWKFAVEEEKLEPGELSARSDRSLDTRIWRP